MDLLDIRILSALQQAGDMTHAALAERVGSTQSTCRRRIQQLKDSGHLSRCVYLADPRRLERGLRVFFVVSTANHSRRSRVALASKLKDIPAITSAFGVTGEGDAIIIGQFADAEEYQRVFDELFDDDDSVFRCTSYFVTEAYKETTEIPCDVLETKLGVA